MSSSTTSRARRTGLVLGAALVPVLTAAPAHAEIPEGWSDPDEVGLLQLLLVIGGIPAILFALIVLAVLLPSLTRGERAFGGGGPRDDWLGGPDTPADELPGERPRELGPTGGASGSW